MKVDLPEISKQIYNQDTLDVLINKYSNIGPQWAMHQLAWTSSTYQGFRDHDKFLIIIYLTMKTLDFYSRNFIKLSYEKFYLKNTVEIEKFNVIEISKNINIPKESARRKIAELEKTGVIKRFKKKIVIDRSTFSFIKPINSIKRMSRFLSVFSKMLVEAKILPKSLSSEELEKVIKDNFSYVWKLYYELQIPMMLGYKKFFGDIETFHIFGTCIVNQHLYSQKKENIIGKSEFIKSLYDYDEMPGLNALSISNITGIPRATVVRKLKKLVKVKNLTIDDKKHYRMTGSFVNKLVPIQEVVLTKLSNFSTKVFNLAIL